MIETIKPIILDFQETRLETGVPGACISRLFMAKPLSASEYAEAANQPTCSRSLSGFLPAGSRSRTSCT